MSRIRATTLVTTSALLLAGTRWLFPERAMTYEGPRAILDAAFALGLLGLILLLAGSLGWKVLRWLRLEDLTRLEQIAFSLPLGLGILAYGILALGLLGLLRPWAIHLWVGFVSVWTWQEWSEIASRLPRWLARQSRGLGELGWGAKAVLVAAGLLLASSLLHALIPPSDYDGLMYHLHGPQLFLQAGRIYLLPDTWQANGPSTIEMLNALGLAWGSDTFAKLLHVAFGTFLVLATFAFGRRFVGRTQAWIAVALLLGIPILPLWASMANTDLGWALYEFLALYALLLWQARHQRRWLALAGLMIGWALGSKYLALGGFGILGLWLLLQDRQAGWRAMLADVALFALAALPIALPWYAKNWLLSGNPIYPLIFGGVGWDVERTNQLMEYLHSFGVGRGFVDLLLLPWNLYAQNTKFGTLGAAFEIPGLLLPLAILYPIRPRDRAMDSVACITGLHFIFWAAGSQQTRFLLPIFPTLALLAAGVLGYLSNRLKSRWRGSTFVAFSLVGATMLASLLFQVVLFSTLPPTDVLLGRESKDTFLRQRVTNYAALQFVQRNLSPGDRVMMMWDGQGYYCDSRCLPDADQSNWTRLVHSTPDLTGLSAQLKARGVTHLLLNRQDANFMLHHEITGRHDQALELFLHEFLPSCAQEIYRDELMLLARITCR